MILLYTYIVSMGSHSSDILREGRYLFFVSVYTNLVPKYIITRNYFYLDLLLMIYPSTDILVLSFTYGV